MPVQVCTRILTVTFALGMRDAVAACFRLAGLEAQVAGVPSRGALSRTCGSTVRVSRAEGCENYCVKTRWWGRERLCQRVHSNGEVGRRLWRPRTEQRLRSPMKCDSNTQLSIVGSLITPDLRIVATSISAWL